jgi:hypothetical protein
MPDGRLGWAIGLAPAAIWPNFATTYDQVRGSANLLRSSAYAVSEFGANQVFSAGGIMFSTPKGWVEQAVEGGARLYRAGVEEGYADNSGLANGPQLVASTFVRVADTALSAQLVKTLQIKAPNPELKPLVIGANKAITAIEYDTVDAASGQPIAFIAFEQTVKGRNGQPDKVALVILRWSTPASLQAVVRPILDQLLGTIGPWSGN